MSGELSTLQRTPFFTLTISMVTGTFVPKNIR